MVIQKIDDISFPMKEAADFSFLSSYGCVFCVFSQNDSGNISFGTDNGKTKYFIKVAGARTSQSCTGTKEAVNTLKAAIPIYTDLVHPCLIQLLEYFEYGNLYILVFKWVDGDCLFDHWNFEKYAQKHITPPRNRFEALPIGKKLDAFQRIFDFLLFVESKGYVAVDFYDGSIMYDFERDVVTICDIDLFRKIPTVNDIGKDFWGTKRMKAPEEYIFGADIDTVTNVFTLGALLFHFFGRYTDAEINEMYKAQTFIPCRYETWELNESLYKIALKAVTPARSGRFDSIKAFYEAWNTILR